MNHPAPTALIAEDDDFEDVEDELISIIKIEGQIWHAGRAEKAGGPEE